MSRWRRGDREAGHQLFTRHFADIHRFFRNRAEGDADELTQRTFLACLTARRPFRGDSSFRTYLFAIARHELYAHLREQRAGRQVDRPLSGIADVATPISGRIARRQEAELLRAALGGLPEDQRMLLELHYWHKLDAAALGEVFDLPTGTVRVRLTRARRALLQVLARLSPEPLRPFGLRGRPLAPDPQTD